MLGAGGGHRRPSAPGTIGAMPDFPLATALAAGPVVLDGGLATQLEAQGHDLSSALWSARLLQRRFRQAGRQRLRRRRASESTRLNPLIDGQAYAAVRLIQD